MEQQCERSQTNEGLVFGALSRLLSTIPDRVTGKESQFAEFPQKCLLRFSTNEREYLGNVPDIFRCNEPPRPDFETCQIAYEPIIGNVGNKVKALLVFSLVGLLTKIIKDGFT